ncbi:MAG TPA: bifunctional phosphoribosyl-AMP cyclohydrolase/phosphoribosyl-ATP diphosphatase HisIE [Bacteroidales bacterium]|nr:bifunctional phosphoribosyl-AMP cyclohydrolase/phosphoribosyl-ATP diphosphatase HisIE [Bacteroidales bacterium]
MFDINTLDFDKQGGLLPAIIQDAQTHKVLMLGYMNREALLRSLESGRVWFFSRSKGRLWEKGETSGNYLYVNSISCDCDKDALLVKATPAGMVCHRQTETCFEETSEGKTDFLYALEQIIRERTSATEEESYTRRLLSRGIDRIAQKVGEEAVEVVIAAKNDDTGLLRGEMADLLYHLLVLMSAKGIALHEVSEVLRLRHRKSQG